MQHKCSQMERIFTLISVANLEAVVTFKSTWIPPFYKYKILSLGVCADVNGMFKQHKHCYAKQCV